MKVFKSVVLTAIVIAIYFSQIISHEGDAALKQVYDQCSEKYQISKEAFNSILNHEDIPDGYEVKCWISCVMKKLGMLKEGKIDSEHCMNLKMLDLNGEDDKNKVNRIAELYPVEVTEEETDECELPYSAAICEIDIWKEFGLPKRKDDAVN